MDCGDTASGWRATFRDLPTRWLLVTRLKLHLLQLSHIVTKSTLKSALSMVRTVASIL